MSDRAMYWRRDEQALLSFASTPSLLRRRRDRLNIEELGRAAAHAWSRPSQTAFEDINLLPPGHLLVWHGNRVEVHRTWDPTLLSTPNVSPADPIGATREAFDRAVERVRGDASAVIAAQLSSGRDSNAVVATAAPLVGRDRLVAMTAAPLAAYDGPANGNEAPQAGESAQFFGIRHHIVRSHGTDFVQRLDRLTALFGGPIGNMRALNWWDEVAASAAAMGARTLLIGTLGNYSINSGGVQALRSLRREKDWSQFIRLLPKSVRQVGFLSTLSILFPNVSEGTTGRFVRRLTRRTPTAPATMHFLRGALRDAAERARHELMSDHGFSNDYRTRIAQLVGLADLSDWPTSTSHDIDLYDPTSDRALVELILSLPTSLLADGPGPRPLYQKLFGDRVPAKVSLAAERGMQGADWYLQFGKDELKSAIARYAGAAEVNEFLDVNAMLAFVERWPQKHSEAQTSSRESIDFLNALAMAAFLYWAASTSPS